jgi:AcrR family transcriptional regulator
VKSKAKLQAEKTDRKIREVFISLMKEEGFQDIRIKEIVTRAEINRGTFYLHYDDKYDLLDHLEQDMIHGFVALGDQAQDDLLKKDIDLAGALLPYFRRFTEYVRANGELFVLLLGEKGDPSFSNRLMQAIQDFWNDRLLAAHFTVPAHYALAVLTGSMICLIEEWVKDGFQEDIEEFMQISIKMLQGILGEIQ